MISYYILPLYWSPQAAIKDGLFRRGRAGERVPTSKLQQGLGERLSAIGRQKTAVRTAEKRCKDRSELDEILLLQPL